MQTMFGIMRFIHLKLVSDRRTFSDVYCWVFRLVETRLEF